MLRGLLLILNWTGVPRLVFRLMLDRRVPLRVKLILAGAVAYFVLPIDIVPDMLPALGRVDDVLVILVSLVLFLAMAPRDIVLEHIRGRRAGGQPDETENRRQGKVVDGSYRVIEDGDDTQQ